jgi:glycosyltransferase involved in cell wall biosynthesis
MPLTFPKMEVVSRSYEPAHPSVWLVMDLEAKKRGSIEEQLLALGERLTCAGVAATFVFSSEPPPWMLREFADRGVELRWANFRRPREAMPTIARWLWAARPTITHFHFVRAYSPLVAVARAAGSRVLVHDHMALGVAFVKVRERSRMVGEAIKMAKRARGALFNRCVHQRIAVSRFVAESIERTEFVSADRIAIIEHGIDVERFVSAATPALGPEVKQELKQELGIGDRPLVACVSRMNEEKGVDVLLRAHARVGRDAVLAIAGDGPDWPRCRALAAELHIEERVRFLGLRRDIPRLLGGCDLVVVPSRAPEAFGLTVVEAMAAGKPVVVTDAGAMADLVDHGRYGIVVPKGDPVALSEAIGRLLDGPVFAKLMGEAGQARARERYALGPFVDRVIALYAAAIPSLGAVVGAPQRIVAA